MMLTTRYIETQGLSAQSILNGIEHEVQCIRRDTRCTYDDLIIEVGRDVLCRLSVVDTYYTGVQFIDDARIFGIAVQENRNLLPSRIRISQKQQYISACGYIRNHWLDDCIQEQMRKEMFASGKIKFRPEDLWLTDTLEEKEMLKKLEIKKVIYNEPATIVYWADGTKTVVKVQKGEKFDKEKGLAMAMVKRMNGDKGNYNKIFKKWSK